MAAMIAALAATQGVGMGLEFLGGQMAANEGVSRRTVRRRGKVALQSAQSRDALFGGLERASLLKSQKQELGAFKGARKALDLGATQARQGIAARGKQNQADTMQNIVSKGLLGTSTGAQRFAGMQDRTSAQLSALDMQLAQAFADLGLEEGAVLGRQGMERTALAGKNRQIQQGYSDYLSQLLTMA